MNSILFVALSITFIGALLSFFVQDLHYRSAFPVSKSKASNGLRVLIIFSGICVSFLCFVVWRYWPEIVKREQDFIWSFGLYLFMALGMFVQVISYNHQKGRALLNVTATQLLFPLLFSPIVFFPILGLSSDGEIKAFTWYSAFLNGYFWETIVTSVHAPNRQTK